MIIKVNGKDEQINTCSIHELVEKKGIKPESVVIELNLNVVKREEWKDIQLKENDKLEILSFVGGG